MGQWNDILWALKNAARGCFPEIPIDGYYNCIVDSEGNEARMDVYVDYWFVLRDALKQVRVYDA